MRSFSRVESTLFVPLQGRIFASRHFPNVLYDAKACELEDKILQYLAEGSGQTEYTLLAGAIRSANMDRYIERFLREEPEGIVVELGCGLETTFYRHPEESHLWYEIDLPEVIAFRRSLLKEIPRHRYLSGNVLEGEWLRKIRKEHPTDPLLLTASGLFYYFTRQEVMDLLGTLSRYAPIEIVFDTVNHLGQLMIGHYMRQVGHGDTAVTFCLSDSQRLARDVGADLAVEEAYYSEVPKRGMLASTRLSMWASDLLHIVKMVDLRFFSCRKDKTD